MSNVVEKLMGLGSFQVDLQKEAPMRMRQRMRKGGLIVITPTYPGAGAIQRASDVVPSALYTGVIRGMSENRTVITGCSPLVLLGDEDGKGADLYEDDVTTADATYETLLRTRAFNLGRLNGLSIGTITAGGTTKTMEIAQGDCARTVMVQLGRLFSKEFKVNANMTVDAGTPNSLFRATPRVLLREGGGGMVNANLVGANSKIRVTSDIEDRNTYTQLAAVGYLVGKATIDYQALKCVTASGNKCSGTPLANITNLMDFRLLLEMDDWSPGSDTMLAGRWDGTGNHKCWGLGVTAGGALSFWYSTDGTTTSQKTSSLLLSDSIVDGNSTWIRVTVNQQGSDLKVKFWFSNTGTTWTQLGVTETITGTPSFHSNTGTPLVLNGGTSTGAITNGFVGKIFAAWLGKHTSTISDGWVDETGVLQVLAYPRFHDDEQFDPAFLTGDDWLGITWTVTQSGGDPAKIQEGNPYIDNYQGGTWIAERWIDASKHVSFAHKTTVARRQLQRFDQDRLEIEVEMDLYDPRFWVQPGDNVYISKPSEGLFNLSRTVTFHGQQINPIVRRCVSIDWPLVTGYGVYYIHPDGRNSVWDLTPFVHFERRNHAATLEVGQVKRNLRPPKPTVETLAVEELV